MAVKVQSLRVSREAEGRVLRSACDGRSGEAFIRPVTRMTAGRDPGQDRAPISVKL